jgi:hypothetical protein
MYQRFKIEGLEYGMGIGESGNVWLDLLGGVTKKGTANRNPCMDLFWDEPNFDDVDLGADTFRVLSTAKAILVKYVFTKKPARIGFSASTERKAEIFRWMASRLAKQLRNYNLVEYPPGVFNFYRLARAAWNADVVDAHVYC